MRRADYSKTGRKCLQFIRHFSIIKLLGRPKGRPVFLFSEVHGVPLLAVGDERRLDDKAAFAAALSLDEEERGRGVQRFCEKAQALGLDAVTPHGAEHVGEALGAVNEGEAPAIAQHTLRRGADVVQCAGGFLARDLARFAFGALAAAGGKVRRVRDHIVDAAGLWQDGDVAKVAFAESSPVRPAVFGERLSRKRCRGRGELDIFDKKRFLAREQERSEKTDPAAEVADRVAAGRAGKVGEAKAVRPRREEGGVVIKAGAMRPELVAFFHVMTLSDDKNKDALSRVLIF